MLIAHSAGGPVGWLTADQRPHLVTAVAAIEPVGPPLAEVPGIGTLTWGLTAAPLTYDPPRPEPPDLALVDATRPRLPALADMPIAVVSADTSPLASAAAPVVEFLRTAGARAHHLHLPDHGITDNGHALILEANSDRTIGPVLNWIDRHSSPKEG